MTDHAPHIHRPFVFFAVLSAIFLGLFLGWSWFVFADSRIATFDLNLAEMFAERSRPSSPTRTAMIVATMCGGIRANMILAIGGAFWMWRHHRRRFAVAWLLIALVGGLIILELKENFGRSRPAAELRDPVVLQENESYPSGHAMGSLVGYGMVGFVLMQRTKSRFKRLAIAAALASWVVIIGFSRVYLRAHWLSDILGGWLLGLAYVNACLTIYFWRNESRDSVHST